VGLFKVSGFLAFDADIFGSETWGDSPRRMELKVLSTIALKK
jgi:hypothetical protein